MIDEMMSWPSQEVIDDMRETMASIRRTRAFVVGVYVDRVEDVCSEVVGDASGHGLTDRVVVVHVVPWMREGEVLYKWSDGSITCKPERPD